jgi:uncharacterized membrane protein YraQ (UPF0718 family)
MEKLSELATNFVDLSVEASPWLLLGLLIAGLMKAWVPTKILSKHLGDSNKSIIKAALIGAPLPLCSCGVIPVATELRRSGASAPATASFLVATPETGVDSVSISYALLGPVFAIYRPITAIASAIITGFLVATIKPQDIKNSQSSTKNESSCSTTPTVSSCCSSSTTPKTEPKAEQVLATKSSCCGSKIPKPKVEEKTTCCSTGNKTVIKNASALQKTLQGVKYASTQLIDDIITWLAIGLIFATLVRTFLPESFLLSYGSGLPAMLMMIVISIPMYICATASTPIAAGFIMAGLSPGTALVFMMAGPATNISTLGVIKKEMGAKVLSRYLIGISVCAVAFGSLLDFGLTFYQINITDQMQHSHELLPYWFGLACALLIAFLAIKPLRKLVIPS